MNQVAFKDCGRVNFANTGHGEGVVQGIHTGRGMTAKCKIETGTVSGILLKADNRSEHKGVIMEVVAIKNLKTLQ